MTKINHFYTASILAEGYSNKIKTKNSRDSLVNLINIKNLIKYVEKNILPRYSNICHITDLEISLFLDDIITNHKDDNKGIIMSRKCSKIFKTPLLDESTWELKISKIENDFLEFIRTNQPIITSYNQQKIYDYVRLSYSRLPKVNKDYKGPSTEDSFKKFGKDFLHLDGFIEVNINKDFFTLSDLAPVIIFLGNNFKLNPFGLTENEVMYLNENPIIFYPFTSKRAIFLFSKEKNGSNIINKIIKNKDLLIIHILNYTLTYTFSFIIFKSNERIILGNVLKTLILNYSNIIKKWTEYEQIHESTLHKSK